MSKQTVVAEEPITFVGGVPMVEPTDTLGQPHVKPVHLGFLAGAGDFVRVRVVGASLQVSLPEQVVEKKKERALLPQAVRPHVSQRYLRFLPQKPVGRKSPPLEWDVLKSIEARLRSLPTRKGIGLELPGVVSGSSMGRWIPHTAMPKFQALYDELCAELQAFLAGLDARHEELYARWEKVVAAVVLRYGLSANVKAKMLAAFPASFQAQVRVVTDHYVIANRADLEREAAVEAAAEAEHLAAETQRVEANAALEAARAAAQILEEEQRRLAWAQVRDALRDVDKMLLQVRSEVFAGLQEVVASMAKGGRAVGPAIRRLRGLYDDFKALNAAGDADLEAALESLVAQCSGKGQTNATAVLTQAQGLVATLQADNAAWQTLVDEYTI